MAARRRDQWLRELGEQVNQREAVRQTEQRDRELEDMREERRMRAVREAADQALRAELQKASSNRKG